MTTTQFYSDSDYMEKPLSKKALMDLIVDLPNNQELSWFTTDKKSFEWVEINQNKPGFLRAIKNLRFERAYLGIFHKKSHKTEYMAFRIIS